MHSIETQLAATWPPEAWQDVTVVLAVSGGADSVALLRAMMTLKTQGAGRLVAAHLNHQLRGAEADGDEAFVVELCGRLDIPCEVGRTPAGELAAEAGDGLEAAAREARYRFLAATAARLGARYVATAHTADDQAETILHRILRGTGIGGLAGMARTRPLMVAQGTGGVLAEEAPSGDGTSCENAPRPHEKTGPVPVFSHYPTLIRPLLRFRRAELTGYLDELRQPYRYDLSNDDLRFTRNRIRGELLPHLAAQYNPSVVEALLRLGNLAGEVQAVIDALVGDLVEQCVRVESPNVLSIDAPPLVRQPDYLIREVLMAAWRGQGWPMQSMGLAQWETLAGMLVAAGSGNCRTTFQVVAGDEPVENRPYSGAKDGPPSKQTFPGNVLAEATADRLRLVRMSSPT